MVAFNGLTEMEIDVAEDGLGVSVRLVNSEMDPVFAKKKVEALLATLGVAGIKIEIVGEIENHRDMDDDEYLLAHAQNRVHVHAD